MASGEQMAGAQVDDAHLWYRGYGWWANRRRFPWLGAFLLAIGAALLVGQADTGVSTGHALALFGGLVLWAAFLIVGGGWAGVLAALFTGWGLVDVLLDLGYLAGSGWTALLVGAGFLLVYLVGLTRQEGRHGWSLWVGLVLVAIGAAQIALREIPGFPPLDAYLVPVILIVIGAWLVVRSLRLRAG